MLRFLVYGRTMQEKERNLRAGIRSCTPIVRLQHDDFATDSTELLMLIHIPLVLGRRSILTHRLRRIPSAANCVEEGRLCWRGRITNESALVHVDTGNRVVIPGGYDYGPRFDKKRGCGARF